MQITGRIMISVVIIAAFSTTAKAYVGHNSCGIEIRILQIVAARELQECTFHRNVDRACECGFILAARPHVGVRRAG